MALIARSAVALVSYDSSNPFLPGIHGLLAGEAVSTADALYLKSDGLLWLADGTAANTLAVCVGFAAGAAAAGFPVTCYCAGWRFMYDAAGGLTPGALLYLWTTPGTLSGTATTGGTTPVARALSTTDIKVLVP